MASVTFSTDVGGDGSTVTDDADPSTGLANGGHRDRFVPSLSQLVAIAEFVNDLGVATNGILAVHNLRHEALGNVSGSTSLSLDVSNYFSATANGNTTFTFDDVPSSTYAANIVLRLVDGGSHTITWPATVSWVGGSAPSLSTTNSDVLTFITDDGGTNWYGTLSVENV